MAIHVYTKHTDGFERTREAFLKGMLLGKYSPDHVIVFASVSETELNKQIFKNHIKELAKAIAGDRVYTRVLTRAEAVALDDSYKYSLPTVKGFILAWG